MHGGEEGRRVSTGWGGKFVMGRRWGEDLMAGRKGEGGREELVLTGEG